MLKFTGKIRIWCCMFVFYKTGSLVILCRRYRFSEKGNEYTNFYFIVSVLAKRKMSGQCLLFFCVCTNAKC